MLSRSADETHRIGIELSRSLPVPGIVLLRGSLGSGKTTLARGIAEGLGLKEISQVSSPSYALVNIYHARCPIYHVDLYRLSGERDLRSIGLDDFLGEVGVTVIEWGERLSRQLEFACEVELEDAGDDMRKIRIRYLSGAHATRELPRKSYSRRISRSPGKSTAAGRIKRP